ncbi:MAG: oligosaccharide flippase family protein [Bacteroidetes bacterium]|nr:oligosaccharide flippase family protein [Bacteroidota bacterium]
MIDRILRLGKETALYGLSTVVGRMLNFLLVPLYAHLLLPDENGVLATLYAYIAFAAVVYGLGMEQSLMRFWADASTAERPYVLRRSATAGAAGLIVSLVVLTIPSAVAKVLGFAPELAPLIGWAAVILAFDALAAVPFALLRMQRRPLAFATLKIANIVSTLLLTVYFLAVEELGIRGVLMANTAASVGTWFVLLAVTRHAWRPEGPDPGAASFSDLSRFGLPLIPAGLAGIALQVVDRPILRLLTDDATVGLYQINFRLGVFMMLFVGMFDFAWRPFFLQHARDADAPGLFARVFTYLMILLGSVFVLVSLFIDDLIRLPIGGGTLIPSLYWEGSVIIPLVLLGYIATGMYVVFLSGTYLEKKTGMIPVIGTIAAAVDIGLLFLLVPSLGIVGAALAMTVAHIVQAAGMYMVSRRYHRVPYEWARVGGLFALSFGIVAADAWLAPVPLSASGIILDLALCGLFAGGLILFRILRRDELSEVVSLIRSRRNGSA